MKQPDLNYDPAYFHAVEAQIKNLYAYYIEPETDHGIGHVFDTLIARMLYLQTNASNPDEMLEWYLIAVANSDLHDLCFDRPIRSPLIWRPELV